jgi:hypothetical protein
MELPWNQPDNGTEQARAHSANEIRIFDPELVLRGVPGKSRRHSSWSGHRQLQNRRGYLVIRSGSVLLSAEALPNVSQECLLTDSIRIEKLKY